MTLSYRREKYKQGRRRLVACCIEVDEDVDGCHNNFGEDEDDDYPLKEFTLQCSVRIRWKRKLKRCTHMCYS
jgi:hypothetical protein